MLAKPVTLPLLKQNVVQSHYEALIQHHVFQSVTWLAQFQQSFKVATGRAKRDRNRCATRPFGPCSLDFRTYFFGSAFVALTCFRRCNLQGNRKEHVVIAVRATFKHCQNLLGT